VDLPDEVLVYDLERHRAHSLNRTAAAVWRRCDGQNGVAAIADLVARELDLPRDEELVWLVLRRLGRAHMLQDRLEPPVGVFRSSRRALMRKLALVGGVALVSTIAAPEAAQAQSCIACGQTCAPAGAKCCSPCQCTGVGAFKTCT
jgi:hypothetical protein